MSDFDSDAYLASPATPGAFDPDAYLAQGTNAVRGRMRLPTSVQKSGKSESQNWEAIKTGLLPSGQGAHDVFENLGNVARGVAAIPGLIASPRGTLDLGCQRRLDEAGVGSLGAERARLSTLKRHQLAPLRRLIQTGARQFVPATMTRPILRPTFEAVVT
jgi:hypothetical protein